MRRTLALIGAAGVAAAVAVALVVGLPATPAAAHAELISSEPASGEVLDSPPPQVALHFTEGVQIDDDAVTVFDSGGDELDLGDPIQSDGGATVTVDLPEIGDGAYVVTWRVTSSDSHPIHGAFTFRVGAAADEDEAEALMSRLVSEDGGDTLVGTVYGAVRFVAFAGLVLLVGGTAFVLVLWPAGRDDRRARRLVAVGWWAAVVATVLSFGLQGAYAAADTLAGALDPSLIGDVVGTRAGRVWLVRLALLVVVAIAGWRLLPRLRQRSTGTTPVASSVGAAANLGDAAGSQAATAGVDAGTETTSAASGVDAPGATDAGSPATAGVAGTAGAAGSAGSAGTGGTAGTEAGSPGIVGAPETDAGVDDPAAESSRAAAAASAGPLGRGVPAGRLPILSVWRHDPTRVLLVTTLGLALLATVSLAGHAGTGRLVPLALVVDVVHLAAVSFWLGGLALLLHVVLRLPASSAERAVGVSPSGPATVPAGLADGRLAEAEQVVRGFSTLAFAAVVAIAATGVIQGWRQTGTVDALFDTTYGRLLITKVALVAVMLAAAFFSRRWVKRRAVPVTGDAQAAGSPGAGVAVSGDDGTHDRGAVRALRRSVGVEVGVAVAVLGLTALLVNTVPGQDSIDQSFGEELHGADVLVRVDIDPASAGQTDVRIETLSHTGEPMEPEEVTASLTLTERDIGPMPLALEPAGPGRYRAADADIPFPGTWTLEVDVRVSEFEQDTVTAQVPVD